MEFLASVFLALSIALVVLFGLNQYSYGILKNRVVRRRRWDLNICCGHTDGGGINADIIQHAPHLPNFKKIQSIYDLPFKAQQFEYVLCSHTIEHVDDPQAFDQELRRVGKNVVYVVPPIWDLSAVLNIFEHKWIFLTFRTEHVNRLPRHIKLPLARTVQRVLGQTIAA